MAAYSTEHVIDVRHWNDTLFSFKTTRDESLRFANGQFVMIGLQVNDRPLLRAYSIASANYEEELEFFSIKVQDGPLTSLLQKIKPGDSILAFRLASTEGGVMMPELGRNTVHQEGVQLIRDWIASMPPGCKTNDTTKD